MAENKIVESLLNLPCNPSFDGKGGSSWEIGHHAGYCAGHHDARHAAAEMVSASTAAPVARQGENNGGDYDTRHRQSSVHPAADDRTVATRVPLSEPCASEPSARPVRLTDEQVYALGEHWHDEESMASVAMEDPTQCEHRALEVNAFCAGYRAGIATPVVQQAGDKP